MLLLGYGFIVGIPLLYIGIGIYFVCMGIFEFGKFYFEKYRKNKNKVQTNTTDQLDNWIDQSNEITNV